MPVPSFGRARSQTPPALTPQTCAALTSANSAHTVLVISLAGTGVRPGNHGAGRGVSQLPQRALGDGGGRQYESPRLPSGRRQAAMPPEESEGSCGHAGTALLASRGQAQGTTPRRPRDSTRPVRPAPDLSTPYHPSKAALPSKRAHVGK